jgi:hypothetical protein
VGGIQVEVILGLFLVGLEVEEAVARVEDVGPLVQEGAQVAELVAH